MMLRVLNIQGLSLTRDHTDEAFARFHRRHVDGFTLQPFGREELERVIGAHHIKGAHFRDHIGRNQCHDLIKACLCANRLRHNFAEAA